MSTRTSNKYINVVIKYALQYSLSIKTITKIKDFESHSENRVTKQSQR